MEYEKLGRTATKVSRIGFGCWAIGGHGYGRVDDGQSIAAIRKALDLGINLFDTADVYGFGHSEEVISKALGNRINDVVVATKFGIRWDHSGRTYKDCSVGHLKRALEGSLRRLQTDCIPLYQLHWHDGVTLLSDVFEALCRFREEGKIRHIGISNTPSSRFTDSAGAAEVVSSQLEFSIASQDSLDDLASFRESHGIATLAYGVLARGLLSGKYNQDSRFGENDTRGRDPGFREKMERSKGIVEGLKRVSAKYGKTLSQVATRWVLENPCVSCALIGIKVEQQVLENIGAVGWHMEKDDRDYLGSLGQSE